MMLSKVNAGKKTDESSGDGRLLKEIETISKALYLDKRFSRSTVSSSNTRSKSTGKAQFPDPKPKPKPSNEDPSRKDKKSIWNWRPLKAFSHIRNRRFNCCFSLQVHLIERLPLNFNGVCMCVYWKRRDGVLVTRPAKVVQGVVEFEEKLTYTCSVYGSRSGPHHSAKYEAKHFLLYAAIHSTPEVDLGKHRVDLTRLLPLTLEELEEEKSSGKWTTSFRLSGMARGAVMNVSFGYMVVSDNANFTRDNHNAPGALTSRPVRSVPSFTKQNAQTVDKVKDLHEVLPTSQSALASSIDILYQKFDEEKTNSAVHEHDKPKLDSFTENLEPFKPNTCPLSDPRKEISDECAGDEEKKHSATPDKPEFNAFQENPEPIESDGYYLSDLGKENPEECEGDEEISKECACDEEKKQSLTPDKSEFNAFQENLEPIESDGCSLSDIGKENPEECGRKFSVIDRGIELSPNNPFKLEESTIKSPGSAVDGTYTLDTASIQLSSENGVEHESLDGENTTSNEKAMVNKRADEEDVTKELLMQELELALNSISDLETVAAGSPKDDNYVAANSEYKMRKSHSLDDITESVASEFLSMLGVDHSPFGFSSESEAESPREHLLRQFEKEALAEGFSLFDFEMGDGDETEIGYNTSIGSEHWNYSEGPRSSSLLQDLLQEGNLVESQELRSKQRAQTVEDLETEALMREWGLNEDAFQHSPPKEPAGFGSPIHLPPEEPLTLPPLAEGLGPFLQTQDGGFLRTMDPSLFKNAKSGGSLIMQVSNPVVVPAEMGSGIMEILQRLASLGIEKLSMQANKLMPLEDITGKTMQQLAWEAMPCLEGTERQCLLQHDLVTGQDATTVQNGLKGTSGSKANKFSPSSVGNQTSSEFASLEDLAPLAMDKIEALSVEGLRIQSGMSDQDAPSNIIAQSIGDVSALQGKGANISGSIGLDGAAGLQLLDIKDSSDGVESVDGLMGLSITLDEWMRLDSGEIDDVENISEHTSKILAAHHANSFDFIRGTSKGEKKKGKGHRQKCGLLGNNFTVALMVQLRDPLRNYEPVGTPMLTLVQVERVFIPSKPKIYCNVSEIRNNNDEDDGCETVAKVESKDDGKKEEKTSEEEGIPQFRITEVHVAGLTTEPRKKKLWGSSTNEKSGSRWLLANGMGKSNKNPLIKSMGASKSSTAATAKVQPGDTLWSISSRVYGTGTKWKELAALNPQIRNPNVIIPDKTIRLK